jgi:hypothetical protein
VLEALPHFSNNIKFNVKDLTKARAEKGEQKNINKMIIIFL